MIPQNSKIDHAQKDIPPDFGSRESWRILKIMAELVSSSERLACVEEAVSIFGSARTLPDHPHYQLAEQIARRLSDAGLNVVTGGGPGIMAAANRGAYHGKSLSIGLNIQLPHEQHSNPWQNVSHTFQHFFARKYVFVKLALAYVVLPGGFGTLDELSEAITLIQTRKTRRIPIILVGSEFWGGLVEWFRTQLAGQKMINTEDLDLITVTDDPDEVVRIVTTHYAQGKHPVPPPLDDL